jgi:hypothetical protein
VLVMFAMGFLPIPPKGSFPIVTGAFPSKLTDVSELAPLNAEAPIEVTLLGMVMEAKELARENA